MTKKIISLMLSFAMLVSFVGVLAGSTKVSAVSVNDFITVDAHGYGYADFPDEYPSDLLYKDSNANTKAKITALMDEVNGGLTKAEKLNMLSADGVMGGDTSSQKEDRRWGTGIWYGVPRVGIPAIRMFDGPMGVRANTGYETTRPSNEVSIASSFDEDLAYMNGTVYGREGKAQSGNMQLGSQNDIIRTLTTSRQRDMFGEDWFLSGTITAAMTYGMQSENVMACLKHFGNIGNADEQTLHETYLSSTEMGVREGSTALAIMTAYGTVNGVPDCQDAYLLQDVARNMWGYKGLFISDWGGNTTFTTPNGMTIETPGGTYNNAEALQEALDDGTLTWDYINQQVEYILYTLAELGYLNLVYVARQGVAYDSDPPMLIELPGLVTGDERQALLDEGQEDAIEMAEKGAILLKNENNALPLKDEGNIALIGFGSEYLVAGHQHECSFGALRGLSYSPADGLKDALTTATVENYVYSDIAGVAIPAEYLFTDAEATTNGVLRTGTDGNGEEVEVVDDNIDFVTNSINYKNAADGNAFEYGEQGANYTWTTYLKAPEDGTYTIKVEGIAATSISGTIELMQEKDGETALADVGIGAAAGSISIGFFGNSSIVTTETGMDIPSEGQYQGKYEESSGGCGSSGGPKKYNSFDLEAGKTYKITVSADGAISDSYYYQRGVKDMQVRLAWITPSQKEANVNDAIAAASTPDTKVILFAHEMDGGNDLPTAQIEMLDAMVEAAEAAGNKMILVLSTAVAVDITKYAQNDNIEAIVEMWLPGQGGGYAMANLLTGKTNFAGKLSITWPTNDMYDQEGEEYGVVTNGRGVAYGRPKGGPTADGVKTELREGIFIGYKWYDAAGLQDQVLYDFGYGLSYADFDYEVVSIEPAAEGVDTYGYDVTVKVTNNGAPGSACPQVYIGAASEIEGKTIYTSPYEVAESWRYTYNDYAGQVDEEGNPCEGNPEYADYFPVIDGVQQAKYQLAGFGRTGIIGTGESEEVTIHVDQRALSYWDVDSDLIARADGTNDKYVVIEGERDFFIATSSDIDNDLIEKAVVEVEAAGDAPTIGAANMVIDNVTAAPGQEVTVNVTIDDNRGIAGYLVYIECDSEYISFVDAFDGGAVFGGHYEMVATDNGYKVLWSNSSNTTKTGVAFTLTAKVADDAPEGVYPITASYSDVNTADENGQMVAITCEEGSITVIAPLYGDVNGDGQVDNRDIIYLARYLVELTTFTDEQMVVADYNKDGIVDNADLVVLARYVVQIY